MKRFISVFLALLAVGDALRQPMTMRIGVHDMNRRQRFNVLIEKSTTADSFRANVATPLTEQMVLKTKGKLQDRLRRKARDKAAKLGVELAKGWGQVAVGPQPLNKKTGCPKNSGGLIPFGYPLVARLIKDRK